MEGAELDSVRSCTGEPGVIAVVKAALEGKCGHQSAARAIEILLSRGAEADERGTEWKSALIHAAASGDTELCDLLLRYGADATITDVFGRTAADWAERGGGAREYAHFPDTEHRTRPVERRSDHQIHVQNPAGQHDCRHLAERAGAAFRSSG